MLFEPVNPEKVRRGLLRLKEINHLYSDVDIDTLAIPRYLIYFDDNSKCAF